LRLLRVTKTNTSESRTACRRIATRRPTTAEAQPGIARSVTDRMSTTVTMPTVQTMIASRVARRARTPITSPWTEMAPSPWRMSDVRLILDRPPSR
jgi:hypothetical protein